MKKIFSVIMAVCGFYFAQGQINSVALDINTMPNNTANAETDSVGVPLPLNTALLIVEKGQSQSSGSSIIKLHVKLGSSLGSANFISKVFDLSQPGLFEDNTSLAVADSHVYIILGSFVYQGTYYAEVKAEMSDGSFGEVWEDSGP